MVDARITATVDDPDKNEENMRTVVSGLASVEHQHLALGWQKHLVQSFTKTMN